MEQQFKVRTNPAVNVDVQIERNRFRKELVRLRQTTAIPQSFLDARAEERARAREANAGRAPLGDSDGAWQKICEIPLQLLFAKLPRDAWEDQNALRKLINDPDLAYFRSDVEKRRF